MMRGRTTFLAVMLLFGCGTTLTVKYVEQVPSGFPECVADARRVAVVVTAAPDQLRRMEQGPLDWTSAMRAAAVRQVRSSGYFTVVDLAHQRERLKEVAYTRTGLTDRIKQVPGKLGADLLLTVRLAKAPELVCRPHRHFSWVMAVITFGLWPYQTVQTYVASVEGEASLLNLRSGKTLDTPLRTELLFTDPRNALRCPPLGSVAAQLPERLTNFLGRTILPVAKQASASLATKSDDEKEDRVLRRATAWLALSPPGFRKAISQWKQLTSGSGPHSLSALWNLAVTYWHRGRTDLAQNLFDEIEKRADAAFWARGAAFRLTYGELRRGFRPRSIEGKAQ